jgi:RNA polymerase sigma factor (sigma-70 family)
MSFTNKKKDFNGLTDEEILNRYFETGNMESLVILYNRYMHLIYGVCMKYFRDREESKDATMEIFEKLAKTLRKETVLNFNGWIYSVTRNHCLTIIRDKKRHLIKDDGLIFMESDSGWHLSDDGIMDDNIEKLHDCLAGLTDEQKTCVELFYLKKKSYREIVSETQYELNKVKSHIQNGKRNLKICIENSGDGKS